MSLRALWRRGLAPAHLLACGLAAAVPFSVPAPVPAVFPGFPVTFEGRALTRLPDTPEEREYFARHPLVHGRFSDGERTILLRWTGDSDGSFHLARPCFAAYGYRLSDLPSGAGRACYRAVRRGHRVRVCETIVDADGHRFADTDSWRRAALLREARAPYWGVSVVEPDAAPVGAGR